MELSEIREKIDTVDDQLLKLFLELEASVHEPGVLPMLEELERSCQSFQFLGNYAEI